MKSGNKEVVYWDTNIFLAWLRNEERPTGEMAGLEEIAGKAESGLLNIATSVITRIEIFKDETGMVPGAPKQFDELFKRPNFYMVSCDVKIAGIAAELRKEVFTNPAFQGKKLHTPDAIHLATAIWARAGSLYTFDEGKKRESVSLLALNEMVGKWSNLKIMKPFSPNRLPFDAP